MDSSIERRDAMLAMFSRLGIDRHTRIRGVDGRRNEYRTMVLFPPKASPIRGGVSRDDTTAAERGCTASHLLAITTAVRDNHPNFIVVEDDIELSTFEWWSFLHNEQRTNIHEAWDNLSSTFPKDLRFLQMSVSDWSIRRLLPQCYPPLVEKTDNGKAYDIVPLKGVASGSSAALYYDIIYARALFQQYMVTTSPNAAPYWDLSALHWQDTITDRLLTSYEHAAAANNSVLNSSRYLLPLFTTNESESTIANGAFMHNAANELLLDHFQQQNGWMRSFRGFATVAMLFVSVLLLLKILNIVSFCKKI